MEVKIDRALERPFKYIYEEPGFIALYLPLIAANFVITLLTLGNLYPEFSSLQASSFHGLKTAAQDFVMDNIWRIALSMGAQMSASIILGLPAIAGTILRTSAMEREGKNMDFIDAFEKGLRFIPRLFVASFIFGLIFGGPFLVFMFLGIFVSPVLLIGIAIWAIPAIYLGTRLFLYNQACVIEDLGPLGGLKEAWNTSEDSFWSIFVILFALTIVLGTVSNLPNQILVGKSIVWGSAISGAVSVAIFGPFFNIAFTILYLVLSKN